MSTGTARRLRALIVPTAVPWLHTTETRAGFDGSLRPLVFVGPQTPWGWVGLVLVATGFVGWCPIYATLGWHTYTPAKN